MFSKPLHLFLVVLASVVAAVSATKSLSLTVSGPEAVVNVAGLTVVATITNSGDETLKVLEDPYSPLSTLTTDTFTITDASGAQPSFTGLRAKYVPRTAADIGAYTVLAPGQSVEVSHDLSAAYDFTTPGAGVYDIRANDKFFIVNEDSSIETIHADIPSSYSSRVSGKLAVTRPVLSRRAKFNGCSESQSSDLTTAAIDAQKYAEAALSYSNSLAKSTDRYQTWFGIYGASGLKTITDHYSHISSSNISSFSFDCTCTISGTYAYVDPTYFGYIHLCGAYWRASAVGTDSKAGTLIHETSHFDVNGGTRDFVYGQSNCRSLATSSPGNAIMNADSHEYFAENTPVQS